jgi:hypothetical protein|tara:strand:- start:376 stop:648 length:273 start_codon:yes stop_codon:yes gene_type:complete
MGIGSFKFSEPLDDKLTDTTRIRYKDTKFPITNKRVLATISIDEFCDRANHTYNKKNQNLIEEYNLYLKSRYASLLKRNWISKSQRKVNF